LKFIIHKKKEFNFSYFRHLQCGTRMRKTVVPSDSGYLTTEGSEKTIGDVNKPMLICFFGISI
jgi:hypothetical protein